jgi:hypothetical protein
MTRSKLTEHIRAETDVLTDVAGKIYAILEDG